MGSEQDDAQFEAGYSGVPTETPEPKQPEPKQEAKTEPEKQEALDPLKEFAARMDKFEASQNKLAGHIGGLTRSQEEIKQLLAASKKATENVADAPTQAQVKEAMASPKEWEELRAEYPEWAAATEKFMDSKLATLKAPPALDPEAIDKRVEERVAKQTAEDRQDTIDTYLDNIVDGDWMEEIKKPEFSTWLDKQPEDIKALAASSKLRDAAKMLRMYQKSKVPMKQPEPKKDTSTRQKRFEAAVTPKGTGGHAPGRSDEDEFMAGYNG
jgi:hypothetical protein